MLFALYNSQKQQAEPSLKGSCLHCDREVIAKCGAKNVWHWAHVRSEECDAWTEPETLWHREWKNKFGAAYSEIRIQKEDHYHIADVCNKDSIIFEFQNSPISSETIKAREEFYGEKMIWILNGISFKENFHLYDEEFITHWKFKVLDEFETLNYGIHLQNSLVIEDWQIQLQEVKDFLKERGFRYSSKGIYELNLGKENNSGREYLILKLKQELSDLYDLNKPEKLSMKVEFVWEHYRRSWQEAKRPIFIDFGEGFLLQVTAGIGKKNGMGNKILKSRFIEKYC